jgi:Primase X
MTRMTIIATTSQNHKEELEQNVANGLDVIISLLIEPIWPRTISTKTTEGRQVIVSSKQEALARYKAANFLDCRISAYSSPYCYGKKEAVVLVNPSQTIDLVMIDLDQSNFKSRIALDRAKSKTLKNIQETFGTDDFIITPSVLWSGNGYHIYIPIESRYVLEERPEFSKFKEPSKQFLRFAEWYLSNGKADSNHFHNVSFGSCMLRIPGSHNSKCVQKNNYTADSSTQVRIVKKWNGKIRAPIYLLVGSFLAYLVDQNIKEIQQRKKQQFSKYRYDNSNNSDTIIHWIESLLETPLCDHRKYCIWRILAPYLMNVRNLSYEESFATIMNWLEKCKLQRRLDFNAKAKIKGSLNGAQKGYFPISLEKLKEENKALYDMINDKNKE